jgi:predicted outer membrane repeat protein
MAYAYGGAIYASYSSIIFNSENVNFSSNTASDYGGAICLTYSASVIFNAVNGDILFIGNKANNQNNDIHMEYIDSSLTFTIAAGRKITMNGGITGNGIINKKGAGDLIFGNASITDFKGKFNIEQGALISSAQFINISTLTISLNGKYSNAGNFKHTVYVDSITISGLYEIGINRSNNEVDILIASTSIIIDPTTSILSIRFYGSETLSVSSVSIMRLINSPVGTDWEFSAYYINGIAGSGYSLERDTNDTNLLNLVLGNIPTADDPLTLPIPTKSQKDNFIANLLTLSANNIISDMLYERMSSPDSKDSVWLGFYGNGYNLGDFSTSGGGIVIGKNFYFTKTSIIGGYVRYGANNAKQESDSATMTDIELGLYAKTKLSNRFNLKGNISGAMQTYSAQSENEDFDFNTKSIRGGFEIEFVAPTGKINIKPFIGIRSGFASNDKIEINDNQEIGANSFAKVETLAGIGIDGKLGAVQNIIWYGKLYGKYIAIGADPKYKVNETEIEATIQAKIQAALSFGAEMRISKPISLFVNGGINFGADLFGFGAGAGVNYRF